MPRTFFKRFLPQVVQEWLDNSNTPFALKFRAKHGPLTITTAAQVVENPSTQVAFCPLCALAIKVDSAGHTGVWLSRRDRTPDNPEVALKKRQSLFVEFDQEKLQVCCMNCGVRAEDGDRFGVLNQTGELIKASPPVGRPLDLQPLS